MKTLPSEPFLRGYLLAAMFTEDPNPSSGEFKDSGRPDDLLPRIPGDFLAKAEADCARFQAENQSLLDESFSADYDRERAGTDLWFSRNGHGAGFWDRDAGDVGERLHEAAKAMGEHHLELGGWWIQEYRCQCGACWTRPEDADNDPTFGEDTCDKCGAAVESLNRQQGEHLTDCDRPND